MCGMQGFNETTGYEKIHSVQVLPQEINFFCELQACDTWHYVESFDRRDYVQTEKLIF